MALYALDSEGIISADEAPDRGQYRCLECNKPQQVRKGIKRRHFYHIKASPSCRLYSKSEDHLLLQLQIQSLFAKGEITLERPFLPICRMADACWEGGKIIFEIQCSLLSQAEAESRIHDYGTMGYVVVWLLDDRLFNRKILRPAEEYLRAHLCYYIHYRRNTQSLFYDQFELFRGNKRPKKGVRLSIRLPAPRSMPKSPLQGDLPKQILDRSLSWKLFFQGDLFHKALLSPKVRPLAIAMQNWTHIEKNTPIEETRSTWKEWKLKLLLEPWWRFFDWLLRNVDS